MTGTCAARHDRPFRVGIAKVDSFTIPTRRVLPDGGIEAGTVGKGTTAGRLTRRVADSMHQFRARHRSGEIGFDWWPDAISQDLPSTATAPAATLLPRSHGSLTVTWPTAGCL